MKHVTFFLILMLLTVAVTNFGFAGKSQNLTNTSNQPTDQRSLMSRPAFQLQSVTEDGVPVQSSKVRTVMPSMSTSTPVDLKIMDGLAEGTLGLSGNYDIPSAFPFNTIENAFGVLNYFGATGDVTFTLLNSTYVENSVTVTYAGEFNITLKPATGVTPTVQFVSTLTNGKGFAFNGAKNITIEDVNMEYASTAVFPTGDAFGATLYITGAAENLTVKNSHIKGIVNNAVWADQTDGRPAIFFWNANADPGWASGVTFDGITVTNATIGLKALCEGDNFSVDNLVVKNSFFGGAYGNPLVRAFIMEWAHTVTFENNVVDGLDYLITYYDDGLYTEYDLSAFYTAFYHLYTGYYNALLGLDKTVFKHNIFKNFVSTGAAGNAYYAMGFRSYGYNLGFAKYIEWVNNKFFGNWMPTNRIAIIYGQGSTKLYHNTFRITGTQAYSGQNRRCVYNEGTSYNNIASNEATGYLGGTSASLHCFFPVGTNNNNAVYAPSGVPFNSLSEQAAVAAGYNANGVWGNPSLDADLNITTGPSSAENIGRAGVAVLTDWTGAAVDTTVAGTRDAGAYQFSTGTAIGVDVFPAKFVIPGSGIPVGPPQAITVLVKNNSASTTSAFDVTVTQTAGVGSYTDTKSVTLLPMQSKNVVFTNWTPTSAGSYSFSATTALSGDIKTGNDVVTGSTVASLPIAITANKTYTWDAGAEGWTGEIDWKRNSTFTKLGGPKAGMSWVTESPYDASTYTEGAYASSQGYSATYPGANLLTSPWLDISALGSTTIYISLDHTMKVEPNWDRSWLQYTTDGLTWHWLGKLNDPKGINVYNQSVYQYAQSDLGTNIDEATLIRYGLIASVDGLPINTWTSNDDFSPAGWVFAQLRINAGDYTPEIVGSQAIRFRYVAFSDAATAEPNGGWAVDNFYIGSTGATFTGDVINGNVFHDVNGNGVNNSEPNEVGLKVYLSYFGTVKDSTFTLGDGSYTFNTVTKNNGLPGTYNVRVIKPTFAFTLPYSSTGIANLNLAGLGSTVVQDFGTYGGSISGKVFEDVDNGSDKDPGESGLGGFVVYLHQDSLSGALVDSVVTTSTGLYTFLTPPYPTYVLGQKAKENVRTTLPVAPGTYTLSVSGTSDGAGARYIDKDFGNFLFGQAKMEAYVDINGNGTKESGDFSGMPAGTGAISWELYKGTTLLDTIKVGDGLIGVSTYLDYGDYKFVRIDTLPTGWLQTTTPVEYTFSMLTSQHPETFTTLYFKKTNLQGNIVEDINGSGTKNTGDLLKEGLVVNMTKGATTLTATTDANGDYFFTNLDPGPWTITPALASGWITSFGSFPSAYPKSSNIDSVNDGFNFGLFKSIVVSGVLFRDRNNNAGKDAGDDYLSGWTVTLTGATATTVTTGANGEFSFVPAPRSLGYTLSVTLQPGYNCVYPTTVPYSIATVSGVDVTGKDFGVYRIADDLKYRTFTYAQLSASTEAKPVKYKAGKAIVGAPNTANLIDQLVNLKVGGTYVLQVGKPTQTYVGGKEKAYLYVTKQGDAYKSFAGKSAHTLGTAKGFDFTTKGGLMMKKWKTMTADKKDDELAMQLLTLQINLTASLNGNTDASKNLGALIYTGTGPWGSNQTIDQIADYADEVMTNWEGIPFSVYTDLLTAVRAINGAFAGTSVGDTTSTGGWTSAKLQWQLTKSVYDVPFLKAAVAPAKNRYNDDPVVMPEVYALGQNYPNPFNPSTTLSFDLPNDAIVTLKIFNILGQEVATVLNRQEFSAGTEEVDFDASSLSSGVYLYQIVAEEMNGNGAGQTFTQVKKMMLMK
ncbi:MAG: T9SS type A sorting domain-containing protein [Ignavibacteriales bacterium]|nr:T9SS type A sorting domain-containing protein [Ignavibacteriales bacterium]